VAVRAVQLAKDFRLEGTEVEIENRGEEAVLTPKPESSLRTLEEVARFMREKFPETWDFPDREQPADAQVRDLSIE
jgi:virulence-associated protein VagC